MKTYSRRTDRTKRVTEEVFPDLVQHPLKCGLSPNSTGNTDPLCSSGTQKRKGNNAKSKQKVLKKPKGTKSGRVSKKEEPHESRQQVIENNAAPLILTNDDPLFGDGLILPVEARKKHKGHRMQNRHVSKNSQHKEAEVSVTHVSHPKTIPPKDQIRSRDKVCNWLASSPASESSKEIFREVHETNNENRHHIFPDDFFRNLHVQPTKIKNTGALEAKRDKFLETFGLLHQETTEHDHFTKFHVTDTPSDFHTASASTQTLDTDSSRCINETVPPKYMSSTMRRSLSTNKIEMFPSDLSAIPGSLSNKKQDETTPQRYIDDFKVPGSPTKSATQRTQRKGALQPKNSTQLFTSGFAQINDFIPQMSTIVMDQNLQKSTPLQKVSFNNIGEEDRLWPRTVKKKPPMKTSTPNKTDLREPQFQFDTDISSVTMGSDNEDEIVFNQSSREVCSSDILHLSTTRIEERDERDQNNNRHDETPILKRSVKHKESPKHVLHPAMQYSVDVKGNKTRGANKSKNILVEEYPDSADQDQVYERQCSTAKLRKSSRLEDKDQTVMHRTRHTPVEQVFTSKQRKNLKMPSAASKLSSNRKLVRRSLSDPLLRTDQKVSLRSAGDKWSCKRTKTQKGSVEMFSVPALYNIEQSAVNARHPMSLKAAREKNLSFKKCHAKGKNVIHNRFNDMFGNPKRTLSFNSTPSKYIPCQFEFTSGWEHGPENKKTNDVKEPVDDSVFESVVVEEPRKRNIGIPVCPLMNDFSCPKRNVSMIMYKTPDTRSYDDIKRTVPKDDLI